MMIVLMLLTIIIIVVALQSALEEQCRSDGKEIAQVECEEIDWPAIVDATGNAITEEHARALFSSLVAFKNRSSRESQRTQSAANSGSQMEPISTSSSSSLSMSASNDAPTTGLHAPGMEISPRPTDQAVSSSSSSTSPIVSSNSSQQTVASKIGVMDDQNAHVDKTDIVISTAAPDTHSTIATEHIRMSPSSCSSSAHNYIHSTDSNQSNVSTVSPMKAREYLEQHKSLWIEFDPKKRSEGPEEQSSREVINGFLLTDILEKWNMSTAPNLDLDIIAEERSSSINMIVFFFSLVNMTFSKDITDTATVLNWFSDSLNDVCEEIQSGNVSRKRLYQQDYMETRDYQHKNIHIKLEKRNGSSDDTCWIVLVQTNIRSFNESLIAATEALIQEVHKEQEELQKEEKGEPPLDLITVTFILMNSGSNVQTEEEKEIVTDIQSFTPKFMEELLNTNSEKLNINMSDDDNKTLKGMYAREFHYQGDFQIRQVDIIVLDNLRTVRCSCSIENQAPPEPFPNADRLPVEQINEFDVYPEQQLISKELFDRMHMIIGEEKLRTFSDVRILLCGPRLNTLHEQTKKRVLDSPLGSLFTEGSLSMIKHCKTGIDNNTRLSFQEEARNQPDVLFVCIVDECHFAALGGSAHDLTLNDRANMNVNDKWLLLRENFFAILVSATPYNCLSRDSMLPERYMTTSEWSIEDHNIPAETVIEVIGSRFSPKGYFVELRSFGQPGNESQIIDIKVLDSNFTCLYCVNSNRLSESGLHQGDDIHVENSEHGMLLATRISDGYQVKLDRRNLSSLVSSKLYRDDQDGSIWKMEKKCHWMIRFRTVNEAQEFETAEILFKQHVNYEDEQHVIKWSTVRDKHEAQLMENSNGSESNRVVEEPLIYRSIDFFLAEQKTRDIFRCDQFYEDLMMHAFRVYISRNDPVHWRAVFVGIDWYFSILCSFAIEIIHQKRKTECNQVDAERLLFAFLEFEQGYSDTRKAAFVNLSKAIFLAFLCDRLKIGMDEEWRNYLKGFRSLSVNGDDNYEYGGKKRRKTKKDTRENWRRHFDEHYGSHSSFIEEHNKNKSKSIQALQIFINGKMNNSQHDKFGSYITEADKATMDLFESCLPGRHGKMKIIRVTEEEWAVLVKDLILNALNLSSMRTDPIEVIGDFGSSSIKKSLKRVPEHLKNARNVTYMDVDGIPCFLILVLKGRMGDTFPGRSFNFLDLRCRSEASPNLATFVQEIGRLCRYCADSELDNLPRALLPVSLYNKMNEKRSIKELNMNKDMHLKVYNSWKSAQHWNEVQQIRRTTVICDRKGTNHYDFQRRRKAEEEGTPMFTHKNRLLLFANPQIGKTGAFIHLLCRIKDYIERNKMATAEDLATESPMDNIMPTSNIKFLASDWMIPYHAFVNVGKPGEGWKYESLTPGKYGERVLDYRLQLWNDSNQNWKKFLQLLARKEVLHMNSTDYKIFFSKMINKAGAGANSKLDEETICTFDGRYRDLMNQRKKMLVIRSHSQPAVQAQVHVRSNVYGAKLLLNGEPAAHPMQIEMRTSSEICNTPQEEALNICNASTLDKKPEHLFANYRTYRLSQNLSVSFGPDRSGINLREIFCLGSNVHLMPQLSIPKQWCNSKYGLVTDINGGVISLPRTSQDSEKQAIQSHIFIPSYNRPAQALVFLDAMKDDVAYHSPIIVVRPGENEFLRYQKTLGNTHIIMELSERINTALLSPSIDHHLPQEFDKIYTAAEGKIGFARLFIQLVASAFQLDYVWQIDDMCKYFESLEIPEQKSSDPLVKRRCYMSDVMLHIERQFIESKKPLQDVVPNASDVSNRRRFTDDRTELRQSDLVEEFTAPTDHYAMVGIRKVCMRLCVFDLIA